MISALSAVGCLNTFVDPHEVPDVICDQILAASRASNVALSAVSFWSQVSQGTVKTLKRRIKNNWNFSLNSH
jgi:hypothetical protein